MKGHFMARTEITPFHLYMKITTISRPELQHVMLSKLNLSIVLVATCPPTDTLGEVKNNPKNACRAERPPALSQNPDQMLNWNPNPHRPLYEESMSHGSAKKTEHYVEINHVNMQHGIG